MALADIVIPTKEVQIPGGQSFAVRGLSLYDVNIIVGPHREHIRAFFATYSKASASDRAGVAGNILSALLTETPKLAADIIAAAGDAPDMGEKIMKLPLGVQADALKLIASLTFDGEGGLKNFTEAVLSTLAGTREIANALHHSTTG